MEENRLDFIREIVGRAQERGASDVHLSPGSFVLFRIDGKLTQASEERLGEQELAQMVDGLVDEEGREVLRQSGQVETGYTFADLARVRVSVFRQSGSHAVVLRLFPLEIPEPKELGIPASLIALVRRRRGLVLVAGASGSGKTTTLASLAGVIARNYARSVLVLEHPAEYSYPCGPGVVLRREIGADCAGAAIAIRAALHQDPDVIVVGELGDAETISAAVTAAETGHLVFGALPADSAAAAVAFLVAAFPQALQQPFRERLAGVLAGVAVQQLLPRQDVRGRAAAFEVLIADPAVCNAVRGGNFSQLSGLAAAGEEEGMQSMDDAVYELYMKSCISAETAVSYAQDPSEMRRRLQLF